MIISKKEVDDLSQPGDILLTCNPAGLGKLINFGQGLEDEGNNKSKYGHVAIFAKKAGAAWITDSMIFESVLTISKNSIKKYSGQDICIIRHTGLTENKFYKGREEILDNIGQIYPAHRILFHGLDMVNAWIKRKIFRCKKPLKFRYMKFMPLDWPVCSELAAQFIRTAGLDIGCENCKEGWRGVNPDDFDDARKSGTLWITILEGELKCL